MKSNSKVVRMTEAGFTLVELMIVVAIIGILAAIAIPNFQKYQAKARQKESQILLSNLYTAEISNRGEHGTFTGCLTNAGFIPEGNKRYYTIGYTAAIASGAACSLSGVTGAIACDDIRTAGVGVITTAAKCTVNVAGVATTRAATDVAFNATLDASPSAFPASVRAGPVGHEALVNSSQLAGGALTSTTFIAGARGSVSNSGANIVDAWTINEQKAMTNTASGI